LPQLLTTIQEALHAVEQWSHRWGLQLSPSKTKAMVFTHKRKFTRTDLIIHQSPIEYVSTDRFLGLTFDQKLTWAPHISRLKETYQADLRLLSIISARGFGADYTTLRHLYTALIRPKLDYGSFLFSTAAPSHLVSLDRIQYAALRIILGGLRCTRTTNLEVEADIPPLNIRRRMLMCKYASRVLTVATHPSGILLRTYHPHGLFAASSLPLPVTGRAHQEFQQMDISYECIPSAPARPKHCFSIVPAHTSLCINHKANLGASQWQALFQSLVEHQYPERTMIFSDGTVRHGQVACAVWSNTFKLLSRLPSNCSIFTAELNAVYSALMFIANKPGKYVAANACLASPHT
jgi:hypothetical protein